MIGIIQSQPHTTASPVSLLIKQKLDNVKQAYVGTTPDEQDYVIPNNVDTGSYQDAEILQPRPYAELDKSRRETTDDVDYQKLLKKDSGYVIPFEGDIKTNEEVGETNSPPGYTELDGTKCDLKDNSYQKLIKNEAHSDSTE